MRSIVPAVLLFAFALLAVLHAAEDEAKLKPESKALEARFKIVKERYDADQRRYVWVLEAKSTSETACHFDAVFQDADDKDVTTVKIEFDDGGTRTMKGERCTAQVKYPIRKTLEKVTQIVIKKK